MPSQMDTKTATTGQSQKQNSISGLTPASNSTTTLSEKPQEPEDTLDVKGEGDSDPTHPEADESTPPPMFYKPPPRQFLLVMIALALCVFLSSLDQIIVSTSIPMITQEYNSLNDIAWLGTAYMMTSTAFQPLYGKISDIFGRKSTILFANTVFMIGSAISGWATSMIMLIIGRAVSGLGAGGLIAMVFIVMSDMLDMRERGKYIGMVSGIFSLSSVIGPLLGGAFADHVTWRWSFWINLPIGAISTVFIAFNLNLPTPKGTLRDKLKRIDFYGSLLLLASCILILLPLSWGGSKYAWNSGIIIGLLVAGVVLIVVFAVVEWKIPNEPILPIHLFKIHNVAVTYGLLFFSGMAFFGIIFYLPVYFQVVKKESATIGGLEVVPFVVGIVITSVGSGIWVLKKGTFAFFPALGNAVFTIGAGLCVLFKEDTPRVASIFILMCCGLGMGLTMQAATLAVQSSVKPKYMATVTASVQFVRSLGSVFGIAVVGSVFNNKLESSLQSKFPLNREILRVTQKYTLIDTFVEADRMAIYGSFVLSLKSAFICSTVCCAIAFVLSCFVQHKELKTNATHDGEGKAKPEIAMEMV
ncbi:hypothetical protein BGX23_007738 [Mortierella sp. AD031]|nr:hypothetical protein BGX23_007738 [Mortierella sp. AD031]KAG0205190.1 hypothetical protein BGX33_008048 [Mortierella sp. NVP41]